jgi:hypothetical protein
MVGVVGSSPIAPTNILQNIKHLAQGAFFSSQLFTFAKVAAWPTGQAKAPCPAKATNSPANALQ